MPDSGKIIKGLNCCCGTGMCFHGCPYHDASKNITECTSQLALEALDLLKEQGEQIKNRDESLKKAREEIEWLRGMLKGQEAVVPVYTTNSHPFHIGILYHCGNCHHSLIRDEDLFCRHCGKPIDWTKKAVKWDG